VNYYRPEAVAQTDCKVVIIRAGPAGRRAAYELAMPGVTSAVLEAGKVVGELWGTADYNGYLFDVGGHRFVTDWYEASTNLRQVLCDKPFGRPKLSRIFYRCRLLRYPLKIVEVPSTTMVARAEKDEVSPSGYDRPAYVEFARISDHTLTASLGHAGLQHQIDRESLVGL
jgi:uncharacterized protein with NAD-binding domain and iron-sulfur cluster